MLAPGLLEGGEEGVRSAKEQHLGPESVAAGEHAQVLLDDGLDQGEHEVARRYSLLLEAVHVGLGEDAALARHRVALAVDITQLAHLGALQLELGGNAVDDGAGAAGALVVHGGQLALAAGALVLQPDDDLGVLAPQLDDRAHIRVEGLGRQGDGVDLLHKAGADEGGERSDGRCAAACGEDAEAIGRKRESIPNGLEELEDLGCLPRLVELIVGPERFPASRLHDHHLDGGRSHIEADDQPVGET